jgi:hypothetical protein
MKINGDIACVVHLKAGQNRCQSCGSNCFSVYSNNRLFNHKFYLKKYNYYVGGSVAESLQYLTINPQILKRIKNFILSGVEMSVKYNNNSELDYKCINSTKLKRNMYSKLDLSSLHKSESVYFSDLMRGEGFYNKDLCYIFCEKCDWFKGVYIKDSE